MVRVRSFARSSRRRRSTSPSRRPRKWSGATAGECSAMPLSRSRPCASSTPTPTSRPAGSCPRTRYRSRREGPRRSRRPARGAALHRDRRRRPGSGRLVLDASRPSAPTLSTALDGKGMSMERIAAAIGHAGTVTGGANDVANNLDGPGESLARFVGGGTGEVRIVMGPARTSGAALDAGGGAITSTRQGQSGPATNPYTETAVRSCASRCATASRPRSGRPPTRRRR